MLSGVTPEVVVSEGIGGVAEGPVWCPDGTLIVTCVDLGLIHRVFPNEGRAVVAGRTAGGPNGAALASDGGVVVAQNGGFDFAGAGLGDAPPPQRVEPSIQLVTPAGAVSVLASGGLSAPNDLVVTGDGTILFTDSPVFEDVSRYPYDLVKPEGRVWAAGRHGALRLLADEFAFCNGIALDLDGSVLVVEANGIVRLAADGTEREWVIRAMNPEDDKIVADGIALDTGGRIYAAVYNEGGIRVFEDGQPVDFLPVPGGAVLTNCCFGGPDMRTLFATSAFPAQVLAWEGLPTPGLPLTSWPGPPTAAQAGS
jgi:gluconolactonase